MTNLPCSKFISYSNYQIVKIKFKVKISCHNINWLASCKAMLWQSHYAVSYVVTTCHDTPCIFLCLHTSSYRLIWQSFFLQYFSNHKSFVILRRANTNEVWEKDMQGHPFAYLRRYLWYHIQPIFKPGWIEVERTYLSL